MSLRQTIYRQLDKPKYKAKLINGWQNTQNIVDAIKIQHAINLSDAQKICKYFKGKDERETAKNIFNFLKNEIEYKVEPASHQTTKSMARFLADGNGDCKHFSLFSNTILQACGYKPKYRLAGYRNGKDYQHIYSYLPKSNTILDAVLPTFDTEKSPKIKKDYDMSLYRLSGTEEISEINGINFSAVTKKVAKGGSAAVKKAVAEIPSAAKKIQKGMATAGLAIPRNAFLELIKLNFNGMASNFANLIAKEGDVGIKWWVDFGGDRSAFTNAVNAGKSKKSIAGIEEENDAYNEIYGGYSGDGVSVYGQDGIGVVVATTAASAAPILIKAADLLSKAKSTAAKAKPIKDAAKKASATFKSITGKDVKDVIFKKEAGKISNKTDLSSSDLEPTTTETATKVASAAVDNALTNAKTSNTKPTNAFQWIKDNKMIVGAGVLALGLGIYFAKK